MCTGDGQVDARQTDGWVDGRIYTHICGEGVGSSENAWSSGRRNHGSVRVLEERAAAGTCGGGRRGEVASTSLMTRSEEGARRVTAGEEMRGWTVMGV